MKLIYNEETEKWEVRKEPFIVVEIETEEDFNFIQSAIDHYKKCNNHGWISVKDRLPPDGNKPYLTCRKTVKGRTVIESRYLHTSYESPCVAYWEGKKNGEVTHWMPLPEPPKEE